MGHEIEKLISNAQCLMLNTSTYLGSGSIERSRDARHESLSTSAQFQIPEKSYTIMSYAGGQLEVEAKASLFIDDN